MKLNKYGISAMAVITLVLIACGGNDPKTFTVTFDADNGSTPTTQTVNEGSKVTEPTPPIKENDVCGLYLGIPADYTFIGWFNGNNTWDFNSQVTGNITLKAKWTTPISIPIDLSEIEGDNILYKTISYIKDNGSDEEKYTLLLDHDLECLVWIPASSVNLTIIGIGSERTISSDDDPIFVLNTGCDITLGKNIILNSSCIYGSILTTNAVNYITMLDASKIIGEVGIGSMASDGNTIITMNGGVISGKAWIRNAQIILSGNTKIGSFALRSGYGTGKIIISPDWSGSIGSLNLEGGYPIDTLKGSGSTGCGFQDEVLIQAKSGYTLTQADITKFPLGNFQQEENLPVGVPEEEPVSISNTHELELDTINNVIKLVAK